MGGLKDEIENVRDNIILPFQMYKSFINDPEMHTPCPSGLLLYGKVFHSTPKILVVSILVLIMSISLSARHGQNNDSKSPRQELQRHFYAN